MNADGVQPSSSVFELGFQRWDSTHHHDDAQHSHCSSTQTCVVVGLCCSLDGPLGPDRGSGCSDISMHLPLNFKQQQPSVGKGLCLKMLVRSSTMTAGSLLSLQKQNGDFRPGPGPGPAPGPAPGPSRESIHKCSSMDCLVVFACSPDSQYVIRVSDGASPSSYLRSVQLMFFTKSNTSCLCWLHRVLMDNENIFQVCKKVWICQRWSAWRSSVRFCVICIHLYLPESWNPNCYFCKKRTERVPEGFKPGPAWRFGESKWGWRAVDEQRRFLEDLPGLPAEDAAERAGGSSAE